MDQHRASVQLFGLCSRKTGFAFRNQFETGTNARQLAGVCGATPTTPSQSGCWERNREATKWHEKLSLGHQCRARVVACHTRLDGTRGSKKTEDFDITVTNEAACDTLVN
jgi:hypothetical protein